MLSRGGKAVDSIPEFSEEEDPMPEGVENLFLGAFLGGAIGDALGSFCEGWPRERIQEVEDLTGWYRDREPPTGARRKTLPNRNWSMKGGSYTDDTQQQSCWQSRYWRVAAQTRQIWRIGF